MAGETLPGLAPQKAFEEGLSIDGLATLLAMALVAVHVLALRAQPPVNRRGRRLLRPTP
jgi:hypothetical protein